MASFAGKALEISRMLGYCDLDDPSNLPPGLAALCRNTDFGLTSCMTRAGVNLQANGVAAGIQCLFKTPVTGLLGMVYQPENTQQSFFQLPLVFQDNADHSAGSLQGEINVGMGTTQAITGPLVSFPARSHMQAAQAYNAAFMAFSNLVQPTGACAVLNLQTFKYSNPALAMWPYGMKPFGWSWLPNTPMLRYEVGTPTTKNVNGHLYQFQPTNPASATGTTGLVEPTWPLITGGTVNDGTGFWTEMTPTFAQVYPVYPPTLEFTITGNNGGSWPVAASGAAQLIFFVATYVTTAGETDITNAVAVFDEPSGNFYNQGSPPVQNGNQSYTIQLPAPPGAPAGFSGDVPTGWNLYVATVSDESIGISQMPPASVYQKWNTDPLPFATPQTVLGPGTNGGGPQGNTADVVGAGQLAAITPLSGVAYVPNTSAYYEYGIRYAAVMFVNSNFSVSGFTQQSVVPVMLQTNGAMIICGKIPIGPEGTIARIVALTPYQLDADPTGDPITYVVGGEGPNGALGFAQSRGDSAGPYFYNGNFIPGPNYFVFPQTTLSDGYLESATVIGNNDTTAEWFSYTEDYLIADNDVTDRLRVIWPYPCVDIFYSASTDRIIQTGVVGFNGHMVSLAADPESYYSDSAFIPTQNADGEMALCAREFRGQLFSLRERSGYVMQIVSIDDNGNPRWSVRKRWGKVGPCGPRAVDVCGKFMVFVHRSGVYKYDGNPNAEGGAPEPMHQSKEIKYWWKSINWKARQTIWCAIDEETHTVKIGVPTGSSLIPNQVLVLGYSEGWNLPIHFSTFAQKEISMDQARRYSIHDVSAYLGARIERDIPVPNNDYTVFTQGDEGIEWLSSEFYTSQFLYCSSAPDGAVPAITPGVWHDGEGGENPATGIDWRYETMSQGIMLMQCKFEGFSLNSRGQGKLFWAILAGRTQIEDWTPEGSPNASTDSFITGPAIDLTPDQHVGDTILTPTEYGERWRAHFSNGKIPDAWAELKYCALYAIVESTGRPESQQK